MLLLKLDTNQFFTVDLMSVVALFLRTLVMCDLFHLLLTDLCAERGAMLDDPLQLLVNQLHTAQTGFLQTLNLPLHQQLKGNLRHKKSWPRTLKQQPHEEEVKH